MNRLARILTPAAYGLPLPTDCEELKHQSGQNPARKEVVMWPMSRRSNKSLLRLGFCLWLLLLAMTSSLSGMDSGNNLRPVPVMYPHACTVHRAPEQPDRVVDLLIVGGTESGVAAAIQAARLGVAKILLVNDISWLGGQFTAEGLAAVDESGLHDPRDKKQMFPRAGLFGEFMQRMEKFNEQKYGVARPGNSWTALTTFAPADGERVFREMLAPFLKTEGHEGPVELMENHAPVQAFTDASGKRLLGVRFEDPKGQRLTVAATLTIDASDWGDVIKHSGATYFRGPDAMPYETTFLKPHQRVPTLMNPLSYCMILEQSDRDVKIPKPTGYDRRNYDGTLISIWTDITYPAGPYTGKNTIYSYRRLIDAYHHKLKVPDRLLMNWTTQDYPLDVLPQNVVEALEKDEAGASRRNIVDMTPRQRALIFEDAKRQSLGLLYYLQNDALGQAEDSPFHFKRMKLSDEFGTEDRLPWKPYIRESLRLEALHMVTAPEVMDYFRDRTWAVKMFADAVLPIQFSTDFHPLHRTFLTEDRTGPWLPKGQDWDKQTARATLPMRSLIPRTLDGLIGAQKNIGVSHRVSAAVRLHGDGMRVGQATGSMAAVVLRAGLQPRALVGDMRRIREVQRAIVAPKGGLAASLWPYWDLTPDEPCFIAAQMLAVSSILPGEEGKTTFDSSARVSRWAAHAAVVRATEAMETKARLSLDPALKDKQTPATWGDLGTFMQQAELWHSEARPDKPLTRGELAVALWSAIQDLPWRAGASDLAVRFLPRGEIRPQRVLYYLLDNRKDHSDWYTGPDTFFPRLAAFRCSEHEVLIKDKDSLPVLRDADLKEIDQIWVFEADHDNVVEVTEEEAAVLRRFYERGGGVWIGMWANDGPKHDWTDDASAYSRAFGVDYKANFKTSRQTPAQGDHELMKGMRAINGEGLPAILKVTNPKVQTVWGPDASSPIIVCLDERVEGKGRLVVDGAVTAFYIFHPDWEHGLDGHDDLESADSERFAENALRWLARPHK